MIWLLIIVYLIGFGYVLPMWEYIPKVMFFVLLIIFPIIILIQFGGYLNYLLFENRFEK